METNCNGKAWYTFKHGHGHKEIIRPENVATDPSISMIQGLDSVRMFCSGSDPTNFLFFRMIQSETGNLAALLGLVGGLVWRNEADYLSTINWLHLHSKLIHVSHVNNFIITMKSNIYRHA